MARKLTDKLLIESYNQGALDLADSTIKVITKNIETLGGEASYANDIIGLLHNAKKSIIRGKSNA